MADAESLESDRYFNTENLGYITRIFEDTYESRFCILVIQKYKEVTEFVNKICVCDMDIISPEELISYESLVQDSKLLYWYPVSSNRWEPVKSKDKFQDQPSLPKSHNLAIDHLVNKNLKQVDFKSHRSGNGSGYGGGPSVK